MILLVVLNACQCLAIIGFVDVSWPPHVEVGRLEKWGEGLCRRAMSFLQQCAGRHTHTHTNTRTPFCNIRVFIANKLGAGFKPSSCSPLMGRSPEENNFQIGWKVDFLDAVKRWFTWPEPKDADKFATIQKISKKPCASRLKWWKRYLILDGLEWYYSYRFLGPGFYCSFIFRKFIYFTYNLYYVIFVAVCSHPWFQR